MCPKCNGEMIEKTGVLFWVYMGIAWIATSFLFGKLIPFLGLIFTCVGIGFIIFSLLLARLYKCKKCNKLFWNYPEREM